MPHESELTDADREKLLAYFKEKGVKTVCPSCGTDKWSLAKNIVEIPVYTENGDSAGFTYPAVLLFCMNCGACRLHAAVQAGVLPSQQDVDKEKAVERGA